MKNVDLAVLQDDADDILGKDCEHISGLEVEGRHPRALMESALFPLKQVDGLVALARTAPPPNSGSRKAGLTSHAITAFILQSPWKDQAAARYSSSLVK